MDNNDPGREVANVPLVRGAKVIIERVRQDTGVPKTEAMTRILEWFASLPLELRLAVLNRNEDAKARLLRTVVVEMAGTDPSAAALAVKDPREALLIIQRMAAWLAAREENRTDAEAVRTRKPKR